MLLKIGKNSLLNFSKQQKSEGTLVFFIYESQVKRKIETTN